MANHTAAKVGGWAFRETVSSSQLNHLQEAILRSPNFDDGSRHVPTGEIRLDSGGGGALVIGIPTTLLGALSVQRDADFGDNSRRLYIGSKLLIEYATGTLNGPVSIGSTGYPTIQVYSSLGGADRTITLLHAGFQNATLKIFRNNDITRNLTIADETGGTITVLSPGHSAIVQFDTTWRLLLSAT